MHRTAEAARPFADDPLPAGGRRSQGPTPELPAPAGWFRRGLEALWLSFIATSASASMMVTDVQGRVERADGRAVALLNTLAPDTELRLAATAGLVLTDLTTGREFVIGGPGRFAVEAHAVRALEGGGRVDTRTLSVSRLPPVKASPRIAQAAVRMRTNPQGCATALDAASHTLAPNLNALGLPVPPLTWAASPGAQAYRVTLADVAGRVLAASTTEATRWALPADIPWVTGQTYTWWVQPLRGGLPAADVMTARFSVLSGAMTQMLQAIAPSDDDPISRRVLYAAQLQEVGAIRAACEQWLRVQEKHPDDEGLARLLK